MQFFNYRVLEIEFDQIRTAKNPCPTRIFSNRALFGYISRSHSLAIGPCDILISQDINYVFHWLCSEPLTPELSRLIHIRIYYNLDMVTSRNSASRAEPSFLDLSSSRAEPARELARLELFRASLIYFSFLFNFY